MAKFFVAFSVYTLAMIGVIIIAFLVWRNVTMGNNARNGTIKIEESLSLNPRKTLYVIRIQSERFLIAADVDKTTFLAKLSDGDNMASMASVANITRSDFSGSSFKNEEAITRELMAQKPAVMRNILKEFKARGSG